LKDIFVMPDMKKQKANILSLPFILLHLITILVYAYA
jgi:hypothetical protein